MTTYPKPHQTKLFAPFELEGHGMAYPSTVEPTQPQAPTQAFTTPSEAAKALGVVFEIITIPTRHLKVTCAIPAYAMAIIEAASQFNKCKKATTYRNYTRADAQHLACYLATAKALGFSQQATLNHWQSSIGKGHGGRSFPCNTILNLRTVKGNNPRYRWYPNRQNHQIEAFLFARLEETHDGSATVTLDGWCYRWQLGVPSYDRDSHNKEYLLLNTAILKRDGLLAPTEALEHLLVSNKEVR